MSEEANILHGPEPLYPREDGTAGQVLHNALLKHVMKPKALINAKSNESISYEVFLKSTCMLAECLKKIGVGQNTVIAICSGNNLFFFYPVIAAFYLGAIVAPLNENYTERELSSAVKISKSELIFCSKTSLPKVLRLKQSYPFVKAIIILNSTGDIEEAQCLSNFITKHYNGTTDSSRFMPADFDNNHPAMIMCSSGTTGSPKSIMITHKGVVTRFSQSLDPNAAFGTPGHRVLAYLPFCNSIGLLTALECLIKGGEVVVLKHYNSYHFLKSIQEYEIESVIVVPNILVFLAKTPLIGQYNLSTLKYIGVCTAPVSKNLQEDVMKRLNLNSIRQGYGLTETTCFLTVTPEDDIRMGSSGKLLSYVSAKVICTDTKEVLGRNELGEIYFKSDLIMKGYVANEEETKQCFDKDHWFKTGDLGYFDSDDHLFIVGRLKELIRYKFFEVPPTELEEILLKHPDIKDAAVIGLPDDEVGEYPAAFVVLEAGREVSEEAIEQYVAGKVSSAKRLRGGVQFLHEIPKNSTGKIRRALLQEFLNTLKPEK